MTKLNIETKETKQSLLSEMASSKGDELVYKTDNKALSSVAVDPISHEYFLLKSASVSEVGQPSIVTVFSIWNTMIGSSLVSIPWAVTEAGLVLGIFMIVAMAGIAYYTCWLTVKYGYRYDDFTDAVQKRFGNGAQRVTLFASVLLLVGALIAYHVLMRDALFSIVAHVLTSSSQTIDLWTPTAAALVILATLFPITNLKNFSVFVKINTIGVVFVAVIVGFICYTGLTTFTEAGHDVEISYANQNWGPLAGMLSLSFFIHNAAIPIMKNQRDPSKNKRDLALGYLFTALSYIAVAVLGYFGFHDVHRFGKDKLTQNVLNMFSSNDVGALIARLSLFLQIVTVFPLLLSVIRRQVCTFFFASEYPSAFHVFTFNSIMMLLTTSFAVFYPNVGSILSYTGALCGLILVFAMPVAVHLKSVPEGVSTPSFLVHCVIVLIGLLFLVYQFVPVQ
eukprot:GILK01001917.1.p1 GENE.GILK01001917.1~~GILK01001917.1.p1  ORF type:complete len:450 (+),score=81.79 GILK01001917.1:80-1429(+)